MPRPWGTGKRVRLSQRKLRKALALLHIARAIAAELPSVAPEEARFALRGAIERHFENEFTRRLTRNCENHEASGVPTRGVGPKQTFGERSRSPNHPRAHALGTRPERGFLSARMRC